MVTVAPFFFSKWSQFFPGFLHRGKPHPPCAGCFGRRCGESSSRSQNTTSLGGAWRCMASGNCDGTGKAKMAAILGILPFENAKKDIMKIVVIWWLYGGYMVVNSGLATCLILMLRTFLIVGSQSSLITDVTTPTLHRPHWQHWPHNTLHTHTCTHHTVASQNGTIPTEKQMDLAIVVSRGSQVTLLSEGWNSTRVKIGSQLLSLMNAVFLCGCNHHVFPYNYNICITCICIYNTYYMY